MFSRAHGSFSHAGSLSLSARTVSLSADGLPPLKGRDESGNAILDLSVSCLAHVVVFIGGWLGVAGSEDAGEAPPECRGARASSL